MLLYFNNKLGLNMSIILDKLANIAQADWSKSYITSDASVKGKCSLFSGLKGLFHKVVSPIIETVFSPVVAIAKAIESLVDTFFSFVTDAMDTSTGNKDLKKSSEKLKTMIRSTHTGENVPETTKKTAKKAAENFNSLLKKVEKKRNNPGSLKNLEVDYDKIVADTQKKNREQSAEEIQKNEVAKSLEKTLFKAQDQKVQQKTNEEMNLSALEKEKDLMLRQELDEDPLSDSDEIFSERSTSNISQ